MKKGNEQKKVSVHGVKIKIEGVVQKIKIKESSQIVCIKCNGSWQ